jgi:hypothetical protein
MPRQAKPTAASGRRRNPAQEGADSPASSPRHGSNASPEEPAGEPAAAASAVAATSTAASSAGPRNRREQFAEIAQRRAAHFARGLGQADGRRADAGSDAEQDDSSAGDHSASEGDDGDAGARPPSQWPGPWSTARALLRNRAAARAARDDDDGSGSDDEAAAHGSAAAAAAPSSSSSARKRRKQASSAGPSFEADPDAAWLAARGVYADDFDATWAPAHAALAAEAAMAASSLAAGMPDTAVGDVEEDTNGDGGGRSAKRARVSVAADGAASSSSPAKAAAGGGGGASAATTPAKPAVRRAVAVAGSSGVRLQVPSLSAMCIDVLCGYTACLDAGAVALLMPDTRTAFCRALCRARAMDNHAFSLFAEAARGAGEDELVVPDCAGGALCGRRESRQRVTVQVRGT